MAVRYGWLEYPNFPNAGYFGNPASPSFVRLIRRALLGRAKQFVPSNEGYASSAESDATFFFTGKSYLLFIKYAGKEIDRFF